MFYICCEFNQSNKSMILKILRFLFLPIISIAISAGFMACHNDDIALDEQLEQPNGTQYSPSHTIPVVYINTTNGQNVTSKTDYIPATFYLTGELSEHDSIGSPTAPVALTIKGRGNLTWAQEKKPYKLKFDEKISLCGLPKSKHYALMAHIVSFTHVWLDNEMAFEMARIMGMPWAPNTVPVELVLNNEYLGVYFLSETVRIEKNRLNIFEQNDGETNPDVIPYGWLIELDNTGGDISFSTPANEDLEFTFHSPENLSAVQLDFITENLQGVIDAIYDESDPDAWTEHLDARALAQYFIIREVLHDSDGFYGSVYLYRDKEKNAKWKFGPLWDCTLQSTDKQCYVNYDFPDQTYTTREWIKRLMHSPAFERAVREQWSKFYTEANIDKIWDHLIEYSANLDEAFEASNLRWQNTSVELYDKEACLEIVKHGLYNNSRWINANLDINDIARSYD